MNWNIKASWMNADSIRLRQYAVSTADHPLCLVCGMDVDPNSSEICLHGKTYYFCSTTKETFDAAPDKL